MAFQSFQSFLTVRYPTLNTGRMIEDMENKIRSTLNDIYFGKTKDIVNSLRSVNDLADVNSQNNLQAELFKWGNYHYYIYSLQIRKK